MGRRHRLDSIDLGNENLKRRGRCTHVEDLKALCYRPFIRSKPVRPKTEEDFPQELIIEVPRSVTDIKPYQDSSQELCSIFRAHSI